MEKRRKNNEEKEKYISLKNTLLIKNYFAYKYLWKKLFGLTCCVAESRRFRDVNFMLRRYARALWRNT